MGFPRWRKVGEIGNRSTTILYCILQYRIISWQACKHGMSFPFFWQLHVAFNYVKLSHVIAGF